MRVKGARGLHTCSTALLVIAHPDDECMFFAPTLHLLRRNNSNIFVLCLSNGNGGGLGRVREKELLAACNELQIPGRQIAVIEDAKLQDGMTNRWAAEVVADHVEQQLLKHPCDAVLTFDPQGVSGHINHKGVHHGVKLLLQAKGRSLGVQHAWQLVSETLLHKYSCLLAIPISWLLLRPGQVLVLGGNVWSSVKAMAAHRSQWVWYRKLFVLLSSYTYVNRLQPMEVA